MHLLHPQSKLSASILANAGAVSAASTTTDYLEKVLRCWSFENSSSALAELIGIRITLSMAALKVGDKCPSCKEGVLGKIIGSKQLECKSCFRSITWEDKSVNPSASSLWGSW
eukprot:g65984.t1